MIPAGISLPMSLFLLARNLSDAKRLLATGAPAALEPGDKRKTAEVISRSAIVLTCASWEAFVEDLALEGLQKLYALRSSGTPLDEEACAAILRVERAIPELRGAAHVLDLLQRNQTRVLGQFNTPKSANVDSLFIRALNLEAVSSAWKWRGTRTLAARSQLDTFVSLRGDIAHRTKAANRVTRRDAAQFCALVERLSLCTANRLNDWMSSQSGRRPWDVAPMRAVA